MPNINLNQIANGKANSKASGFVTSLVYRAKELVGPNSEPLISIETENGRYEKLLTSKPLDSLNFKVTKMLIFENTNDFLLFNQNAVS